MQFFEPPITLGIFCVQSGQAYERLMHVNTTPNMRKQNHYLQRGIGVFIALIVCGIGLQSTLFLRITNEILTFYPRMALKGVPAPPDIVSEQSSLNPLVRPYRAISYDTSLSLSDTIQFYQQELPRQAWKTEVLEDDLRMCMQVEQNGDTFVIEIYQFPNELVKVLVYFEDSWGYCPNKFRESAH